MKQNTGKGVAIVILASVFWSTSGVLISLINSQADVSPVSLAFWRDLSTFAWLLVVIGLFRPGLLKVKRKDLPWLVAMGILSVGLFHVFWNLSVLYNGVALGTVLHYSVPVFVAIFGWLFLSEPLTRRKIGAVVLAVSGVVLISLPSSNATQRVTLIGLAVGISGAIAFSSYSLFGRKLAGDYNAWTIMLYIFGFGALVLLPFQFVSGLPAMLSTQVLGYFLVLVLLSTIIGFGIYTIGLHYLQASVAAITVTTEVLFATGLAFLILGERLDIWQVLGAILVIAGVILISIPARKRILIG
jgi:drug/metabolite transporter (DMT)-like permease